MLDLQIVNKDNLSLAVNKENFPLVHEPQNKRSTQLNQVPSITIKGMWTNEALE
jgi:hypothetical protein